MYNIRVMNKNLNIKRIITREWPVLLGVFLLACIILYISSTYPPIPKHLRSSDIEFTNWSEEVLWQIKRQEIVGTIETKRFNIRLWGLVGLFTGYIFYLISIRFVIPAKKRLKMLNK